MKTLPQIARLDTRRRRIFIVDDHPVFRAGLVAIIEREPDLEVSGEAGDPVEAMQEIRSHTPDLVLVDLSLPGAGGLELINDIHTFCPEVPILAVSMHEEFLYAERVLSAGGRGYIMKCEGPTAILGAIRKILEGQVFVSDQVALSIVQGVSTRSNGHPSPAARLTQREFEVLQLIGKGKSGKEIAGDLNLSVKTVNTHRGQLKKKFGLKHGAQLIHHAVSYVAAQSETRNSTPRRS